MEIRIMLEIFFMIILFFQINAQNIIKDGDFQSYILKIKLSAAVGKYDWKYYQDSWYGGRNKLKAFQITNYLNQNIQGLDTIQGEYSQGSFTCQEVALHIDKAYILAFDYVVDQPDSKIFRVTLNDQLIYQQEVYHNPIAHFQTILRPSATTGILCFIGFFQKSKYWALRGVIVDNIILEPLIAVQHIEFDSIQDWNTKKLILSSNFKVDPPSKLIAFNETQIRIGSTVSPILSIRLGVQQNLIFITDLDIQLNQSSLEISIIIPDDVFIDQEGYSFQFITNNSFILLQKQVKNMADKSGQDEIQFQQTPYQQKQAKQSQMINIFTQIFKVFNAIDAIGIAAMIIKFLSFANIYILYIVLDIKYLDSAVRLNLETFARIIMEKGPIQSFSEQILGKELNLTVFKIQTGQKVPKKYITQGSSLSSIYISTNLYQTCFEDLILIAINCIKILIVWLIISKLKSYKLAQKQLSHLNFKIFKIALLTQAISIAPTWVLSTAITLSSICQFASSNFLTKANQSVLMMFPLLLLLFWFSIQLNYRQKKKRRPFKIKKLNQQINLTQENFVDRKKCIKVERISGSKYICVYSFFQKIEPISSLFYIIFGFLIGYQNLYLFFTLISCYKITVIVILIKKSSKNFAFLKSFLQILLKSAIHFSFLALFIFTKLVELNKIEGDTESLQTWSGILSMVILYSYLCGIILQVFIFITDLLLIIRYFIGSFSQNKQDAKQEESSNAKKVNFVTNQLSKKQIPNHEIKIKIKKNTSEKIFPKNCELVEVQELNDGRYKLVFDIFQDNQKSQFSDISFNS